MFKVNNKEMRTSATVTLLLTLSLTLHILYAVVPCVVANRLCLHIHVHLADVNRKSLGSNIICGPLINKN